MGNIKHVKSCRQSNRLIYQSKETLKHPQAVALTKVYLETVLIIPHHTFPLPSPKTAGKMGEITSWGLLFEESHRQLKYYTVVLLNYC